MDIITYDAENPSHIRVHCGLRNPETRAMTVTVTNLKTMASTQFEHPGRRNASAITCNALFQEALALVDKEADA